MYPHRSQEFQKAADPQFQKGDSENELIVHYCELQFQLLSFVEARKDVKKTGVKSAHGHFLDLRTMLPNCGVRPAEQERVLRRIQEQLERFINTARKDNVQDYQQNETHQNWKYNSVPWDVACSHTLKFDSSKKAKLKKLNWLKGFKDSVCFLKPGQLCVYKPGEASKPTVEWNLDKDTNVGHPEDEFGFSVVRLTRGSERLELMFRIISPDGSWMPASERQQEIKMWQAALEESRRHIGKHNVFNDESYYLNKSVFNDRDPAFNKQLRKRLFEPRHPELKFVWLDWYKTTSSCAWLLWCCGTWSRRGHMPLFPLRLL